MLYFNEATRKNSLEKNGRFCSQVEKLDIDLLDAVEDLSVRDSSHGRREGGIRTAHFYTTLRKSSDYLYTFIIYEFIKLSNSSL